MTAASRTRTDLCPGVHRPWVADDGLLVRVRLVGGLLSGSQLAALIDVAERFGDGTVQLTSRANLQVRGLPGDGCLPAEVIEAMEATGLIPTRSHELVRNILVSPQSGYAHSRADLRPVAADLDAALRANPDLANLSARFLFVLDDRGDLLSRATDLGLVALDAERCQLRIGDDWGPVVPLASAVAALIDLARQFAAARGDSESSAWHVRELPTTLTAPVEPSGDLPSPTAPLAYGVVDGGDHMGITEGLLTRENATPFFTAPELVVTPWRSLFIPDQRKHA